MPIGCKMDGSAADAPDVNIMFYNMSCENVFKVIVSQRYRF